MQVPARLVLYGSVRPFLLLALSELLEIDRDARKTPLLLAGSYHCNLFAELDVNWCALPEELSQKGQDLSELVIRKARSLNNLQDYLTWHDLFHKVLPNEVVVVLKEVSEEGPWHVPAGLPDD